MSKAFFCLLYCNLKEFTELLLIQFSDFSRLFMESFYYLFSLFSIFSELLQVYPFYLPINTSIFSDLLQIS